MITTEELIIVEEKSRNLEANASKFLDFLKEILKKYSLCIGYVQ